MAKQFGQGGSLVITGSPNITVCLTNWDATYDFDVQTLTTTCSGGYQELGPGVRSLEVTFSGFFDPTVGLISELTTGNTLDMTFNIGSSGSFFTADFIVKSYKVTNPATEYVTIEATVGSTGAITVNEA